MKTFLALIAENPFRRLLGGLKSVKQVLAPKNTYFSKIAFTFLATFAMTI
jgi:hypothetical protein